MAKRFVALLLTFLLLTSCKVGNSVLVFATVTPFATTRPTLTPTQTSTPTVSPDVMRYQCLEIANSLPTRDSLKGVIVYDGDYNLTSWLSDQETGNTYLLPREANDTLWQFGVSPDGQHLKYIHSIAETQKYQLVIATSDGKSLWSQNVNAVDWDWFDNERLVYLESSENGTHRFLLLNPFSGEQKHLPADFPGSEAFSSDMVGHWFLATRGVPIYDPTLTRAVYPVIEDKQKWPAIILWDTQANKDVAQIVTVDYWGNTPLWTPDGKQFIIATNMDTTKPLATAQELFAVSRDGQIRQLTHFMDYYQGIEILDDYSLSPNGKLLAFWITVKPSQFDNPRLAVLNIETGEVTNYCIKGDPFADNAAYPDLPVWSPDSTQLLVISRPPEDTKVRRVVVVDIGNNYAAQINQDMEPVGWMVAP